VTTGARFQTPNEQFANSSVTAPLAGGKLNFYITGTSTRADTYSDSTLVTPNANPVVLDSAGRAGAIFLDPTITYKVVLTDSNDVQIWTADPVSNPASTAAFFSIHAGDPNGSVAGQASPLASVVWDTTSNIIWVCTTTGSSTTAVWTQATGQLAGAITFTGILSPPSFSTQQDNYNPTGLSTASELRINLGASASISGLAGGADGRAMLIVNYSSFVLTLLSQSTSSTSGNRFLIPAPIALGPNQSVGLRYDATSAGWRSTSSEEAAPTGADFKNLVVTNGATGDNQMTVTADNIVLVDSNGLTAQVSSVNVTADVTTSGANGLDTGSVGASTWYFVWVIYNPTTNTTASLLSLSSTAPTMPSGYTYRTRVGANVTDVSNHFMRIRQMGRKAQYKLTAGTNTLVPPNAANGVNGSTYSTTSPTLVAVTISGFVPSTASMIWVGSVGSWKNGASSSLLVAPSTAWGGTNNGPQGTAGNLFPIWISSTSTSNAPNAWMVLEGTSIGYAASAAGGAVSVFGWEDNI